MFAFTTNLGWVLKSVRIFLWDNLHKRIPQCVWNFLKIQSRTHEAKIKFLGNKIWVYCENFFMRKYFPTFSLKINRLQQGTSTGSCANCVHFVLSQQQNSCFFYKLNMVLNFFAVKDTIHFVRNHLDNSFLLWICLFLSGITARCDK